MTPGKPRVESDRYEVPINLSGAQHEVAALDFTLAYDPAVFQPVSISPGAAASAAGKVVTANLSEPGNYIVVMMGFNQTPVANGEVARIVLERVGSAALSATTLTVNEPTLSTWEGAEVPAEGGTSSVEITPKEAEVPEEDDATPDTDQPAAPETPTEGQAPNAKPRGNPQASLARGPDGQAESVAVSPPPNGAEKAPVPVTAGANAENAAPDVAAAAERAAAERGRLGETPGGSDTDGPNRSATVATKQDGTTARSTDIQTASSLKIEASAPVNNNTAGSTRPEGTQRAGAGSVGWTRLALAAAIVLAAAGGAWFLRSRIFR